VSVEEEGSDDADEVDEGLEEEVDTDGMDKEDEEEAYPFFFFRNLLSFVLFLFVLLGLADFIWLTGPVLSELRRVPNNCELVSGLVGGGGCSDGVAGCGDDGGGGGRLDFFFGLVPITFGGDVVFFFFFFAVTFGPVFFFGSIVPTKSMGGEGKAVVLGVNPPLKLSLLAMVFMDFMAFMMPFSFGGLAILRRKCFRLTCSINYNLWNLDATYKQQGLDLLPHLLQPTNCTDYNKIVLAEALDFS